MITKQAADDDSVKPNPFGGKPEEKKDSKPSGGLFGFSSKSTAKL